MSKKKKKVNVHKKVDIWKVEKNPTSPTLAQQKQQSGQCCQFIIYSVVLIVVTFILYHFVSVSRVTKGHQGNPRFAYETVGFYLDTSSYTVFVRLFFDPLLVQHKNIIRYK